jgi:hypothetical protein
MFSRFSEREDQLAGDFLFLAQTLSFAQVLRT